MILYSFRNNITTLFCWNKLNILTHGAESHDTILGTVRMYAAPGDNCSSAGGVTAAEL